MNGFKVYRYYIALKLHFTTAKFNVFVNRGHVKGSYDKFIMRNDRMLFERLAKQYPTDKECIQFLAANFMYGNPNMIYEQNDAVANYKEFQRRRQSMTHVFTNDLNIITNSGAQYDFSGSKIPDVLQLLLSKRITLETMVILNDFDGIVDKMKQNSAIALLMENELLLIEKSKGFVRYDSYKVMNAYQTFIEDLIGTANG